VVNLILWAGWLLGLLIVTGCTAQSQAELTPRPASLVVVPAGWFVMGQDEGHRSNQPQRQVYLDSFAIDRTEVTQAAFAKFVTETGYRTAGWHEAELEGHADEPAVGVIWREADAYCRWAGQRLPTEAEWEKAARGTDGRRYPWGNTWDPAYANTAESQHGGVLPVGSFPAGASPYGALDMAGNAAEWVADYFDFDYYTHAPDHNPPGPTQVLDHSLRGGSWASPSQQARTYFRDSSHSVQPNPRLGFRCAQTLTAEPDRK
jgi:formylglycine-generating enzyme required for sulfatase activity